MRGGEFAAVINDRSTLVSTVKDQSVVGPRPDYTQRFPAEVIAF